MSEDRERAATVGLTLGAVVRDTFANDGFMLTGLVGIATYINPDGARCWCYIQGDVTQAAETTIGLTRILDNVADAILQRNFSVSLSE